MASVESACPSLSAATFRSTPGSAFSSMIKGVIDPPTDRRNSASPIASSSTALGAETPTAGVWFASVACDEEIGTKVNAIRQTETKNSAHETVLRVGVNLG
jgi:hypothetical protein